ncbi:hypothetical protein BOTBODRAFT_90657, partial [Botryobasidium botryosum FD-172 SS1]
RPPSAYLLYQNEVRHEVKKQHDGLPYHEVLGKISGQWSDLTDEGRAPYIEATRIAKQKYEVEKKRYDAQTV